MVETSPVEAILFDLDGTLIDSIELIRQSYHHTLREHLNTELPHEEWLAGLGRPLRWQFAQLSRDEAQIQAMIATYRAYNLAHHDAMVRPYPGALEAVSDLARRGYKLGLVTSKMRQGALRGLAHCGFGDLIAVVVGADDVTEAKPHPMPVLRALELLGCRSAASAVMVGDSPHDLASGRAAGARTAAVAWGPFPHATLRAESPDVWLADTADISRLLGVPHNSA